MVLNCFLPLVARLLIKEKARNKEGREMIYVSDYDDVDNEWIEPVLLGKEVNVPGRQNSVIAISNDGQRLLKYQDDQYGNGDIYESFLKGMKWSDPISISAEINSNFHESSASIAPDGRTIYFVSNRKGGQGGRDIWLTKKNERGEWSAPENLGSDSQYKSG
jgi:OmpA-OmpF porin, OOP family